MSRAVTRPMYRWALFSFGCLLGVFAFGLLAPDHVWSAFATACALSFGNFTGRFLP